MKQLIYTILLMVSISLSVNAQEIELTRIDSLNTERSQRLLTKIFGTEQGHKKYLIFGIGDDLLFIYDSTNVFKLNFLSENFNYTTQQKEFILVRIKQVDIHKKPLSDFWFRKKVCSKPFIYSGNQNVLLHPNYIYFMISDGANEFCEFNLPVQENGSFNYKQKIPLNKKLFNYLLDELLPYVAERTGKD